jgi:hypothetical protein
MTINPRYCVHRLLTTVLMGVVAAALAGCGGGPVPAPTAYKAFEYKDGGWAVDYPEGWDASAGGKKTSSGTFSKGSATIKLQSDLAGSLMSEGGGYNKLGPPSDEDFPVHKAHVMGKDKVAGEFGDYKEQEPTKFNASLGGEGRKSEFTASGGFSGPVHGYRATLLSRDYRFTIVCVCSESDWKNLQPAFDKVLESFRSAG